VPAATREALNLESGLNDGICVPVIIILLDFAIGTEMQAARRGTFSALSSRRSGSAWSPGWC
jgi:hypothetical protein